MSFEKLVHMMVDADIERLGREAGMAASTGKESGPSSQARVRALEAI